MKKVILAVALATTLLGCNTVQVQVDGVDTSTANLCLSYAESVADIMMYRQDGFSKYKVTTEVSKGYSDPRLPPGMQARMLRWVDFVFRQQVQPDKLGKLTVINAARRGVYEACIENNGL